MFHISVRLLNFVKLRTFGAAVVRLSLISCTHPYPMLRAGTQPVVYIMQKELGRVL